MTYFITPEYFRTVLPLLVVLVGAVVSLKWPVPRVTGLMALAALIFTWPASPSEAFSRVWAHDVLTAVASLVLFAAAAVWRTAPVTLFGALVCAGANDALLLACGAALLMAKRELVLGSVAILLCVAGSTELGVAGRWGLLVLPPLLYGAWQARQPGLALGALRVLGAALLPAEWAWRIGFLK